MAVSPRVLAGVVLTVGAAAVYSNSFHVPFVFDDWGAVVRNPTLHSLWPPWGVLRPPAGGFTTTGRPLLNLSLALNYAAGGLVPLGYHLVNLALHVLAALTLLGWLRRTFSTDPRAVPMAFAAALVWALHPLQTEAVTYISQRAESQMALCYLLTVYWFRVGCDRGQSRWLMLSALACLCGMATKEVMASAPVIVLCYDRTFVAGSFAAAWRQRRSYYLGLAATWLVLAGEIAAGQSRGGTIGFGLGISWVNYLVVQCCAVTHYLRLALWPRPLVFDYGLAPAFHPLAFAVLAALLVVSLAGAALWAFARGRAAGFWGLWFFAILAPTSLVPGNRQTWAEHRMYLALVPLAVLFGWLLMRRRQAWTWPAVGIVGVALGAATFARNRDYRSNRSLWTDTAAKRPENAFAQYNLGEDLLRTGEYPAAEAALRRAIALNSGYAEAHNNLGTVFAQTGRAVAAQAEFVLAARLKPGDAEIRNNAANALLAEGKWDPAEAEYRAAIADDPAFATPHNGLAQVQLRRKNLTGAVDEYRAALRLDPDQASVRGSLGAVLLQIGQPEAALREFAEAARQSPGNAAVHFNYGNALAQQRRFGEAEAQYRAALAIEPGNALVHFNYGTALVLSGQMAEARAQYQEALRLKPDFEKARDRLRLLQFK